MSELNYEVLVNDGLRRHREQTLPDGSPIISSPIASTLIYGDHDAVLVDPPMTCEQVSRVGDWIETFRQTADSRLRHPRTRRPLVRHRPSAATVSRRRRVCDQRHDRDDASAGHRWPRRACGTSTFPARFPQSRHLSNRSGRRYRPGRPRLCRRGRPHRHRRHHGAARAVHRTGRRRRRRLQRRASISAGERARRHRGVAGRTGQGRGAAAPSRRGRPQEQGPARRSGHPRADPRIPAERPAAPRRKAQPARIFRRDDRAVPGPAQCRARSGTPPSHCCHGAHARFVGSRRGHAAGSSTTI